MVDLISCLLEYNIKAFKRQSHIEIKMLRGKNSNKKKIIQNRKEAVFKQPLFYFNHSQVNGALRLCYFASLRENFPSEKLNHKPVRDHRPFLNHNNPIFYRIERVICISEVRPTVDAYIVSDPTVLIYQRVLDETAVADPH